MKKYIGKCLSIILSLCLLAGTFTAMQVNANGESGASGESTSTEQSTQATPKYMIHYKYYKNNGGILGQSIKLYQDETYTISFQYKMVEGEYNEQVFLKILPDDMANAVKYLGDSGLTEEDVVDDGITDEGTTDGGETGDTETTTLRCAYNSGYTPSTDPDVIVDAKYDAENEFTYKHDGNGIAIYTFTWPYETGKASILFHTPGGQEELTAKDIEFYFANMTLTSSDSATTDDTLESVDKNNDLRGWRHPYYFANDKEMVFTPLWYLYTATLMDYDENIFQKMIHYKDLKAGQGIFGQNINLEYEQNYTISFDYHMLQQSYNTDNGLQLKIAKSTGSVEEVTGTNIVFDSSIATGTTGGFATEELQGNAITGKVTYTFKWTEANDEGHEFVYLQTPGGTDTEVEFYLANMTLYKSADSNKINLLEDINSTATLNGWRHPGTGETDSTVPSADEVKWTAVTSEVARYNVEVVIADRDDYFQMEEKMIHIKTTEHVAGNTFGKIVALEADKQYTISFQYKFREGHINESVIVRVRHPYDTNTGIAHNYFTSSPTAGTTTEKAFDSTTYDNTNTTGTATFTFTNVAEGNYGIGFEFITGTSTDMYLSNFIVYETSNNRKVSYGDYSNFGTNEWRGYYTVASGDTWTCTENQIPRYTATITTHDEKAFSGKSIGVEQNFGANLNELLTIKEYIAQKNYKETYDFTKDGKVLDDADVAVLQSELITRRIANGN